MTDFKGFNPDKNLGTSFNTNRQNKKTQSEANPEASENQTPVDPYADLKMDPDRMLDLLAAQGKSNQARFTGPGNAGNIDKTMEVFTGSVSPERHSFVTRMLEQTYQNEFGKKPSPTLLQDIVDDYLIGQVSIQAS